MRELIISQNEAGQRFDKLLHKYLKNAGTSFLYKMLRKKNIVLNDKKADGKEILQLGDSVKIYFSEETFQIMTGSQPSADCAKKASQEKPAALDTAFQKYKKTFVKSIVYEDEHLLLLNKPAGWLSQPDGSSVASVNDLCLAYLTEQGKLTEKQLETFRPGIANRLDRNTSGLILFGKTLPALQELAAGLKARTLKKYYLAVVRGALKEPRQIDGFLTKNERTNHVTISAVKTKDSSEIHTAYEPLISSRDFTVLKVHLITGKTHQIRAHLASIGHPILGDVKYGSRDFNKKYPNVHSQLLHAWKLEFPDCSDGVLGACSNRTFTAEPPESMQPFLAE
ncbi:MAG TPA: RluA family pseudouridine synthase [Oribacterium sp.]|nr:RluA family pseudouridine synthase [Oribacterium sp.]